MKVTDRLLADHKSFRKMLDDLEDIARAAPADRDHAKLRRLAPLLKRMVSFHAQFEDRVFFPSVEKALLPGDIPDGTISHLTHEHKTIEGTLDRLLAQVETRPPAPAWPQTFALLASGLRGHFRREEESVFPLAEKRLPAPALERLAAEAPAP